jgi:CTD kinase subunit alpha
VLSPSGIGHELLLGETQYGPAVDIWSAACVLIEIFTKHAIFPGDGGEINQLDKIYNIMGTPTRSEWPGGGYGMV